MARRSRACPRHRCPVAGARAPTRSGSSRTALAIRYSGSFVPPDSSAGPGLPLPRVSLVEPWNEPNLSAFLSPQWINGKPTGPELYRRLLNAVYDGYKSVQPDSTIIAGATGPRAASSRACGRRRCSSCGRCFCLRWPQAARAARLRTAGPLRRAQPSPDQPAARARRDQHGGGRCRRLADARRTPNPPGRRAEPDRAALRPAARPVGDRDVVGDEPAERHLSGAERAPPGALPREGAEAAVEAGDPGRTAVPGPRRPGRRGPAPLGLGNRRDVLEQRSRSTRSAPCGSRSSPRGPRTTRSRSGYARRNSGEMRITATRHHQTREIASFDVARGEVVSRRLRVSHAVKLRAYVGGEASLGDRVPDRARKRG